jgi:hypothetical protein
MKYYDVKKDERERHRNSLKAEKELANKAELVAFEKGISYEKAAEHVRKMNPRTAEMAAKGFISEQPGKTYAKTSMDAGTEIAQLAKAYMREHKVEYEAALKVVLKQNPALADAYAFAD